ncbi:4731_t:CDS:2 [Cetraspora pellucida]|uniref:4731_t:CDS:1 n=1 Tax=Cetraspora pellucida TaxID=1433469 RepID=A0A9N8ZE09_9GLOM|nr:4731_t:CDS:2 [Cetraspora pellucida]
MIFNDLPKSGFIEMYRSFIREYLSFSIYALLALADDNALAHGR